MAGVDYDGIEAIFRIAKKGEEFDTFAIEVLTFHAAVEFELDEVLRNMLRHPDKLLKGKPKLSFPHKAKLVAAMWQNDPDDADKLNLVLRAFQDLRDEIAHPSPGSLKTHKANLVHAFRGIEPEAGDDPSMLEIAQGISMFLANDAGTLAEFRGMMGALGNLVSKMPGRINPQPNDKA